MSHLNRLDCYSNIVIAHRLRSRRRPRRRRWRRGWWWSSGGGRSRGWANRRSLQPPLVQNSRDIIAYQTKIPAIAIGALLCAAEHKRPAVSVVLNSGAAVSRGSNPVVPSASRKSYPAPSTGSLTDHSQRRPLIIEVVIVLAENNTTAGTLSSRCARPDSIYIGYLRLLLIANLIAGQKLAWILLIRAYERHAMDILAPILHRTELKHTKIAILLRQLRRQTILLTLSTPRGRH